MKYGSVTTQNQESMENYAHHNVTVTRKTIANIVGSFGLKIATQSNSPGKEKTVTFLIDKSRKIR